MRYAKNFVKWSIFRDFTIFFLIFSNHHPNHEDEVILRRKLKEEKEQIDEAPIVPVLRPQKIEESPGKDSKLKLEYLSPIWAYLRPIKHTWAHMSPWEPNLRPFELIWELLSPFEHIWAWFEPTWAQLNLETRISKSNF